MCGLQFICQEFIPHGGMYRPFIYHFKTNLVRILVNVLDRLFLSVIISTTMKIIEASFVNSNLLIKTNLLKTDIHSNNFLSR